MPAMHGDVLTYVSEKYFGVVHIVCACMVPVLTIYKLDTETRGSTAFRNPRARGCSARVKRGRY